VRFVRTNRFRHAYRKLDERYHELVKKALAQFLADRTYPGLRIKRIQGTDRIWEMRAGRDIRITFEFQEDTSGTRAVVLRNPRPAVGASRRLCAT
jgi:mRNA-degrading endonuclease RelE of RelBE toxin-antitoxin system